jgi:transcriptional regulator with XRE-family HTH domain
VVRYASVPIPRHRRILGEAVRNYRKQLRMSQEKLAEKADLNPKYIGEVERGTMNISVDALARIAHALKTRVGDLTTGF